MNDVQTQYPAAPAGYEVHHTNSSLGRRLLLSHTEIARKIASGELKPRGSGAAAYHFSSETLDRMRADVVAKVGAKYQHLSANEQQRVAAIAAELAGINAKNHFRATPNREDVAAGQLAAQKPNATNTRRSVIRHQCKAGQRTTMKVLHR